ncbi:MAG: hypothetical protein ACK4PR_13005, partial [Gammaproteobacteria bacterium]
CILGLAQLKLGKTQEAWRHIEHGLTTTSSDLDLKVKLGIIKSQYEYDNSGKVGKICQNLIEQYESDLTEVYMYYGKILIEQLEIPAAIAVSKKVISLRPTITAYRNLLSLLSGVHLYPEAIQYSDEAMERFPESLALCFDRLWLNKLLCDWDAYAACQAKLDILKQQVTNQNIYLMLTPFCAYVSYDDPAFCLSVAKAYCEANFISNKLYSHDREARKLKKELRVGYVSACFKDHPTGRMLCHVFKQTSKKYQTYLYSLSGVTEDEYNTTLRESCDHFIDIKNRTVNEITEKIYHDDIDILIDLDGYIRENKFQIFASRPAPIQISYLGFAGTTGANFIDYIIADNVVIPEDQQQFYTEKVIYLPGCYQINDSEQTELEQAMRKKDYHVAAKTFIFACFNTAYKIDYETFKCWMTILKAVPESILWLIDNGEQVKNNIHAYAKKLKVDPERICFLPYLNKPEHLARLRVVDLCLDTFICNAHSSAADALWSNIPIVTLQGKHFASRVC